jgi:hypothetical protein
MALRGKGPTMVWAMWMLWVITVIFLGLRVYTRLVIVRSVGWDDYLLSIGSVGQTSIPLSLRLLLKRSRFRSFSSFLHYSQRQHQCMAWASI